jgi:hypothetical protein
MIMELWFQYLLHMSRNLSVSVEGGSGQRVVGEGRFLWLWVHDLKRSEFTPIDLVAYFCK